MADLAAVKNPVWEEANTAVLIINRINRAGGIPDQVEAIIAVWKAGLERMEIITIANLL